MAMHEVSDLEGALLDLPAAQAATMRLASIKFGEEVDLP